MKDYVSDFKDKLEDESFSDSELITIARDFIEKLQDERNDFCNIAYNTLIFTQLADQSSKEELERELGCTEQELLDIADGDEAMIENLGLGE